MEQETNIKQEKTNEPEFLKKRKKFQWENKFPKKEKKTEEDYRKEYLSK
jgi:hypothetical protein